MECLKNRVVIVACGVGRDSTAMLVGLQHQEDPQPPIYLAAGAGAAGAASAFGASFAGSSAGGLWHDLHLFVKTAFTHSRKWPLWLPQGASSLNTWVHKAMLTHIAAKNVLVLIR